MNQASDSEHFHVGTAYNLHPPSVLATEVGGVGMGHGERLSSGRPDSDLKSAPVQCDMMHGLVAFR